VKPATLLTAECQKGTGKRGTHREHQPGIVDAPSSNRHLPAARYGLSYRQGGLVLGGFSPADKIADGHFKARDLGEVDKEFERSLAHVESDPPAAIAAACSILESLFKVYIEDNGLELPNDQSIKPLWKVASRHLGFDPSAVEDEDIRAC
jgi:hypothetical protein